MEIKFGILTISDRSARGERKDISGPALRDVIIKSGWQVEKELVIPDDLMTIRDTLVFWSDVQGLDIILTTGGTGFSPRDVTPEATLSVIERQAQGLAEAMRAASMKITPHAMLSRAISGIRGQSLIINLPGSPKAALENLEVISPVLTHAVQLILEDSQAEAGHKTDD